MGNRISPTDRLRIIVTGYIVRRPLGGLTWHYLQYVIGLAQLGHEVFYLEDSEDHPCCFDPSGHDVKDADYNVAFQGQSIDPTYGLEFARTLFERVGMDECWAYYDSHTSRWLGPRSDNATRICRTADVLLNVSNSIALREWMREIPTRALIDTDPGFAQVRHIGVPGWLDRALQHNAFLTFGENVGQPNCDIPGDGFPWRITRQPIDLDAWPTSTGPANGSYTTVMSWKSYEPGKFEGKRYGLKSDSFLPHITLPTLTGARLELAMDGSREIRSKLEQSGWQLRDAFEVTRDPWTYQQYIQQSKGEFSVAKHAYVVTRSGWFSERSACYLASGRPVITQETGFSDWMETGAGVLGFTTTEEAVAAIDAVNSRYQYHCERAREIAAEYFDFRKVLPGMLESAVAASSADVASYKLAGAELLDDFRRQMKRIKAVVAANETFILVDDNRWGVFGVVSGRTCLPFLERDGLYWGSPADDDVAIQELERMRREGAAVMVFAEPAFWWLDYYPGLKSHLRQNYASLDEDENLVIFDLRTRR